MVNENSDPLGEIEKIAGNVNKWSSKKTRRVFRKYPVTFSLLVLFGVSGVLHGIEELITITPILDKNPILVLILGLIILVLTGTLYKKLEKKLD